MVEYSPLQDGAASTRPLTGHHAAVTGAGRGIGLAIATRLAELGASLTLIGRDRARLEAAARTLNPITHCEVSATDIGDADAVQRCFDAIATDFNALDILVNNAGVARSAAFAHTDRALWDEMLRVNLTGTFLCARAALPLLQSAPAGRIVNVASTAGLMGYPYVTAYCAAKHGVVGLTRALAQELARTSITVNAVCPGYTDTDLTSDAIAKIVEKTGRSAADARAVLVERNPQGRLVTPAEVAHTVAWLCLPQSAAITGQSIAVAGGEVGSA